jgi:hypothetical protein
MRRQSADVYRAESGLALAAALVTSVECVGLTVFYEKDSFHRASEGANGNSDELEALDFSVRIDCVYVSA